MEEEGTLKKLLDAKAKADAQKTCQNESNEGNEFEKLMKSTENYKDIMEPLCQYIKELTSATGVYIGELTTRKKPITDNDIMALPPDETAPQIIKYIAATEDHAFMKMQYLESNKGVTYGVFKAKEEEAKEEEKEIKEGDTVTKKTLTDEEKAKKQTVFIKEVLREDKMHYFVVPRLGSYLAIPLLHKAYLSEPILETAINDYLAYKQKLDEQVRIKKEYDERVAEGMDII